MIKPLCRRARIHQAFRQFLRSRRRNLSRAVAGMALAIIVAVTAVATELSLDLWGRHAIYGRRLAQAQMRLDQTNLADQRAIALLPRPACNSRVTTTSTRCCSRPDLQLIRVNGVSAHCQWCDLV